MGSIDAHESGCYMLIFLKMDQKWLQVFIIFQQEILGKGGGSAHFLVGFEIFRSQGLSGIFRLMSVESQLWLGFCWFQKYRGPTSALKGATSHPWTKRHGPKTWATKTWTKRGEQTNWKKMFPVEKKSTMNKTNLNAWNYPIQGFDFKRLWRARS